MRGDALYHDPRIASFYDLDNDWGEDRAYCHAFAKGKANVLDLGCGTGDLAVAIAESYGSAVTGVDPAAAMLDIARKRDLNKRVNWIEADARQLDLANRFDLIVMTGHAFQCFLTRQARIELLTTARNHLTHDGQFIFDSRNPSLRAWEDWVPNKSRWNIDHPTMGRVFAWNDVHYDTDRAVAAYETCYRIEETGETLHARSEIVFPSMQELEEEITLVGLVIERWMGDWSGGAFSDQSSEMIPILRRAS